MIQRILAALILLFPLVGYAAPSAPEKTVWITPADAKKGETVELSAFVYNGTTKAATVTVVFSAGGIDINTATLSIASQTAKTGTIAWKMPAEPVEVTATVTKAIDANKKTITDLLGPVGTLEVGGSGKSAALSGTEAQLKGILGSAFSSIEPWRQKQAEYFTQLRNKKREELGIKNAKDVYDALTPKAPEAPAAPGTAQTEEDLGDLAVDYNGVNIGGYFVLLYATALAAIFSSLALFYITAVLLALMVLRFILRMFR